MCGRDQCVDKRALAFSSAASVTFSPESIMAISPTRSSAESCLMWLSAPSGVSVFSTL